MVICDSSQGGVWTSILRATLHVPHPHITATAGNYENPIPWMAVIVFSQAYLCDLCGCRMQYLETTKNTGAIIFDMVYIVHASLQFPCFPSAASVRVCVCWKARPGSYTCQQTIPVLQKWQLGWVQFVVVVIRFSMRLQVTLGFNRS